MKHPNYFKPILLAIAVLFAAVPLQAQQQVSLPANYRGEYKQGEVIVKFKDDKGVTIKVTKDKSLKTTGVNTLDKALKNIGMNTAEQLMPRTGGKKLNTSGKTRLNRFGKPVEEPNLSRLFMMTFEETPENSMQRVIKQLEGLDEVEYAFPNYYVYTHSDGEVYAAEPMRSQQWYLDAIRLPELWEIPKLEGAKRPIIAIIDTGVDITHPDLVDNIWTNQAEANGAEKEDDDQNGFVDDLHGWSFVTHSPNMIDRNGHGTHCAGIAAAVGDNGIGITGANPDALIMPVTVMEPDGVGTASVIIQGIDYAIDNGADVLSMSFGSSIPWGYDVFQKAYQTSILTGAAGNDNSIIYRERGRSFPGAFDVVLGIQASNEQNAMANFSNFDPDGPYYVNADWFGSEWWNYEIWAPGQNILSTYPGGTYKIMSGTSMATPLVAGAVSRLLQTKEPENYRDVWIGDLVAAKAQENTIVMDDYSTGLEYATSIFDAMAAYNFNENNRNARLSIAKVQINDSIGGDGDGRFDSGEIIELYPVLRSEWGQASNIRLSIMANPLYESASSIEIIENNVDFGYHLNSRGSMRSKNPLIIKVADNVEDAHILKLRVTVTCDNILQNLTQDIEYKVENGEEISGVIYEDMILYPNKHYIVNKSIYVPQGITLTILPGTRLEFNKGCYIQSDGKLIANGTPEQPIIFTNRDGQELWGGIHSHVSTDENPCDTLSYCTLDHFAYNVSNIYSPFIYFKDCIFQFDDGAGVEMRVVDGVRNNFVGRLEYVYSQLINYFDRKPMNTLRYSNFINFITRDDTHTHSWNYNQLNSSNLIHSGTGTYKYPSYYSPWYIEYEYIVGRDIGYSIDHAEYPSWLGTSKEEIIRPYIYDSMNPNVDCFTTVDLSNMPTRPYSEAHGVVWKVVVDGYDAQDEFDQLPPLGVGRHEFKVYFNRPEMDHASTPVITMGLREPYTQTVIAEDGAWSVDDGVAVYTAYLTITGKTNADGVNRICVTGAKDDEFFEVPIEKWRFNVLVQAAGSMATGFAAEAGMGNVKLTWNNENNDFEDAMGFNVYRFQLNAENDTINMTRLNETIIDLEDTEYVDYEVTPNETYYYYYKVLSTDLKEYDISNVVAATPLTSTLGDANASGEVDVADVITTVNYAAGMEPRPFIFEAADVNVDTEIDILDVIGIIRIITNPNAAATASIESVAEYWVNDGVVWLETPVDLAGVQVSLDAPRNSVITPTEDLNGFEKVSTWLADNDYLFLAYSMAGRTLSAGRHPILNIGDNEIADIRMSDAYGHNVMATPSIVTAVETINADGKQAVPQGIYDLMGRKISSKASDLNRLPHGIYIVNGKKVVK